MIKKKLFFLTVALLLFSLLFSITGCSDDIDLENIDSFTQEPAEYYLNYYVTKSPMGLNWETPSTLARDLLKNAVPMYLGSSTTLLGHVNIELGAKDRDTIYAGMSNHDNNEGLKLIFKDKTGLGLLFHNMAGSFDTEEGINNSKKNYVRGKASIITFTFKEERYNQIKSYIENFLEKGEQYNYGLYNNPFISESKGASSDFIARFPQNKEGIPLGAGCTAFGVSSLQELGVADMNAYEQWHSAVKAPQHLIGQYSDQTYSKAQDVENLHPMNRNVDQKISLWRIIFKGNSWAEPSEPGKDIVYYCPDRMFAWINAVAEKDITGEKILSGELVSVEKSPSNNRVSYRITIALD